MKSYLKIAKKLREKIILIFMLEKKSLFDEECYYNSYYNFATI